MMFDPKRTVWAVLILCCALLVPVTAFAEEEKKEGEKKEGEAEGEDLDRVIVELEAGIYSKQVWRGINVVDDWVLQPNVDVLWRSFTFTGWGNFDLTDENGDRNSFTEIDKALAELENEGFTVIPTARATQLTMNREGIRRLAAEELELKTSAYQFAQTKEEYLSAVEDIGLPCVIKPIMSSSGKGQSLLKDVGEIEAAWEYAQAGGRAGKGKVIVEGFVDFDFEITLLTVRHRDGTSFCAPIGHRQEGGDYQESWQPQAMSKNALSAAQAMAEKVTTALGGKGLFGVELFIKGDDVIFSEVSPRPHDTGLVTLVSQDLSEFALHARAILDLPIPTIRQNGPGASSVILVSGESRNVQFGNLEKALSSPDTQLRLFGKPEVSGSRRMGVALARGDTIERAREIANASAAAVKIEL